MEFIDYKCLESLLNEGKNLIAEEGFISSFRTALDIKRSNALNNSTRSNIIKKYEDPVISIPKESNESKKTCTNGYYVSDKLKELYSDDCEKEFKYRTKMLNDLINVLTEANRKFGKIPGFKFKDYITNLKEFIKDPKIESYDYEYDILSSVLPHYGPKTDVYDWATYGFAIYLYATDIRDWAESQDRVINCRNPEECREYHNTIKEIDKFLYSKMKKYSDIIEPDATGNFVTDYGDWDNGIGVFQIKPTEKILNLASRCSDYKDQF